ncbi:KdsC family phosphatase [Agaribacterium haliotis]|uniref:KdsC family phosphatase n=1 Tax=Agaribacterium haliotis TaxID=2013869 RepID=UPI000BB56211|nr:HAD family hydrolase [Agaribacterium haliotis]
MPRTVLTRPELLEKARKIKLLVLDVDGVLSDGKIYFDNNGLETKSFNTLDGQGLKQLKKSGVELAIITGRKSAIVERRAKELGIELLIQGREDKFVALQEILAKYPCELENIAHMGDDWPDLCVMSKVGLALGVANGHWQVKELADWISERKGGEGAVRDACDMLMLAQGTYQQALAPYVSL